MHLIRKLANTVRDLAITVYSSFASLRTLFAAYSQLIRKLANTVPNLFAAHSQLIRKLANNVHKLANIGRT